MYRKVHPEADDRRGVEPTSMHKRVPANLKEAKPKAGSIAIQVAVGARAPGRKDCETDRRRERSPEANIESSPIRRRLFSNTYARPARRINPTKINRVGRRDEKGTWARMCRDADPPAAGANLRRDEPQERRRTIEGRTSRPARPRTSERSGSGTPRERRSTAHDPNRTAEFLRRRSCDWIVGERVNRIRRSHSRRRSKMTALSDSTCTSCWSTVKAAIERTSRRFIHHASIAAAATQRERPQGRRHDRESAQARAVETKRRSGIVQRPAALHSATRPASAEGDKTS